MLLGGKIAIVTGAASERGIGRATAKRFAEEGATVAIIDLDERAAQQAAAQLGNDHIGLGASVADEAAIATAIAAVITRYGRIDILVNNAGITQPVKTLGIKREDYDRILDVFFNDPELRK